MTNESSEEKSADLKKGKLLKAVGVWFGISAAIGNTIAAGIVRTPGDIAQWVPNEYLFLGGLDKAPFLSAYKADMFFDDKKSNCLSAAEAVTTGHVPHGVLNKEVAHGMR